MQRDKYFPSKTPENKAGRLAPDVLFFAKHV